MKTTVADFAKKHEVPVYVANGFMNFLVSKGLAEKVQQKQSEDGKSKRGRPSVVFELNEDISITV